MMSHSKLIWTAVLGALLPVFAVQAQSKDNRDMLPLRFARPSSRVRRRFREDWDEMHNEGKEWAYCVTQWSIVLTQDKDTVYVADDVELVRHAVREQHGIGDVNALGCVNPVTKDPLPIAHAHPSGDCSPSRTDITMAVIRRKAPFELIVCGRESTVGYVGQMYQDLIIHNMGKSVTPSP